ncbi:MAG: glutamate-1-semialdehyde 2,1-aminomutase [Gammaproteobacteria bacterium]|jgi:glutamate-1-semialdehyde 2,1-aminomutase
MTDADQKVRLDIETKYQQMTPTSARLNKQGRRYLPSGVVHDSRHVMPYGLYASHASGSRKWDVDGNEYIDYYGGHGALMLGHNQPDIVKAVNAQLLRGTHFATNTELEILWAQKICAMIPGAERVRFHSSGTEATQMAVRLARAYTGKNKLMRFFGHYHGWLDDMTTGFNSHFDGSAPIGVPEFVASNSIALDPYKPNKVERHLNENQDIAAVIVEPFGAATGKVPITSEFLHQLRNWTRKNKVLLIFDEVVTGFRAAPGGEQSNLGIIPDLTALAKIVAGGLPGGAVTGLANIMAGLDYDPSKRENREKIFHPGTFNACPVSATAGIETLKIIQQGKVCEQASQLTQKLRDGLNGLFDQYRPGWIAYGKASAFHLYLGNKLDKTVPEEFAPESIGRERLYDQPVDFTRLLRLAMNIHGVDIAGWPGGLVSAAHTESDIDKTLMAFSQSLELLRPTFDNY